KTLEHGRHPELARVECRFKHRQARWRVRGAKRLQSTRSFRDGGEELIAASVANEAKERTTHERHVPRNHDHARSSVYERRVNPHQTSALAAHVSKHARSG